MLATAALGLDATTNLAPSVIGLLVRPEHRGRGIGTALVQTCLDVARNLGLPCVYISTSVLGSMLERTGWHKMGEARFLNDERGSVYVRDL